MKNCLIGTRNCCVSNYGVTIVYLYNDNKIIDINDSKLKCLLSCLCVIPFKLLSKFIKYYNSKSLHPRIIFQPIHNVFNIQEFKFK